jgi:hypothetical protein
VVTSAHAFKRYHLYATLFWMAMIPVAFITGLARSIAFITLISLWALVSTEWGAWQASRAEVKVGEAEIVEHAEVVEHADTVEATA